MKRFINGLILTVFCLSNLYSYPVFAQINELPAPGTMIGLSAKSDLPLPVAIEFNQQNPFDISFILSRTQKCDEAFVRSEGERVAKYFFAALAMPPEDLWVNLSPYEAGRIATEALGHTELGKDLLGEDYVLKQLAASLTYPETEVGKKYWNEMNDPSTTASVSAAASPQLSLTKVWITPGEMLINEQSGKAGIVKAELKVYCQDNNPATRHILPMIEKEINEGAQFAHLRQIYRAVMLAGWFKRRLKESILSNTFFNQNKIKGADCNDPAIKEKIYNAYLEAFKRGAYNYVKRELAYPSTGSGLRAPHKIMRRAYFSGGAQLKAAAQAPVVPGPVNTDGSHVRMLVHPVGSHGLNKPRFSLASDRRDQRDGWGQDGQRLAQPYKVSGSSKQQKDVSDLAHKISEDVAANIKAVMRIQEELSIYGMSWMGNEFPQVLAAGRGNIPVAFVYHQGDGFSYNKVIINVELDVSYDHSGGLQVGYNYVKATSQKYMGNPVDLPPKTIAGGLHYDLSAMADSLAMMRGERLAEFAPELAGKVAQRLYAALNDPNIYEGDFSLEQTQAAAVKLLSGGFNRIIIDSGSDKVYLTRIVDDNDVMAGINISHDGMHGNGVVFLPGHEPKTDFVPDPQHPEDAAVAAMLKRASIGSYQAFYPGVDYARYLAQGLRRPGEQKDGGFDGSYNHTLLYHPQGGYTVLSWHWRYLDADDFALENNPVRKKFEYGTKGYPVTQHRIIHDVLVRHDDNANQLVSKDVMAEKIERLYARGQKDKIVVLMKSFGFDDAAVAEVMAVLEGSYTPPSVAPQKAIYVATQATAEAPAVEPVVPDITAAIPETTAVSAGQKTEAVTPTEDISNVPLPEDIDTTITSLPRNIATSLSSNSFNRLASEALGGSKVYINNQMRSRVASAIALLRPDSITVMVDHAPVTGKLFVFVTQEKKVRLVLDFGTRGQVQKDYAVYWGQEEKNGGVELAAAIDGAAIKTVISGQVFNIDPVWMDKNITGVQFQVLEVVL